MTNELYDRFEYNPGGRVYEVSMVVADGASNLADTWYLRPSTDLRDEAVEIEALFALLSGEESATELYEEPADWVLFVEDERFIESLEAIRRMLPFSQSEVGLLRGAWDNWSHEEARWQPLPSVAVQRLVKKWQGWLREPPADDTNEELISAGASRLYIGYVTLYEYLRDGLK